MKQTVLTALLLMATVMGLNAQQAGSRLTEDQRTAWQSKMEAYKKRLNLTEQQSEKVEAINREYLEVLSSIKMGGGSKLSKYKKFKQANREKDKEMKEVLNDEQYKIYKQQQQEFKDEIKSRRTK